MGFCEEEENFGNKRRIIEEKLVKNDEIFQETCRIYHNIHNLTGNNVVKKVFF